VNNFRTRCTELLAAMESYPLRPKAHRDLCNRVRAELEHEPLIEGRWYWVRFRASERSNGDWFPAKYSEWCSGGWSNDDCWEDFDREVIDWRLITPPEDA
jgi:hypothetical protein